MADMLQKNIIYGIIEDDKAFRSTLAGLLRQRKDTKMVYEFTSGEEAIRSNSLSTVDFLFIDYKLNGMDGITFLSQPEIKKLKIPKLILTGFNAEEKIFEALKHGVTGYMFKEEIFTLNSVLEILLSGGAFISPSIALRVISYFQEESSGTDLESLSNRENQILEELCNGYSPKEIADTYKISLGTVRTHIKNIYAKLEVNNQLQLLKKKLR